MIPRYLHHTVKDAIFSRKAIIITGARQVGKTTLLKLLQKELQESSVF